MKERPILFSAPMVRAILEGRKTQTRRAIKPQPEMVSGTSVVPWQGEPDALLRLLFGNGKRCRYGQPGDRLWVRESFRLCAEADNTKPRDTNAAYRAWYEADAPHQPGFGKLRPGIHMPRWASRITLRIKSVRVERLNQISEADAWVEGIEHDQDLSRGNIVGWRDYLNRGGKCATAVGSFKSLWQSINGPGSWDANPWVWVIEFKVAQP